MSNNINIIELDSCDLYGIQTIRLIRITTTHSDTNKREIYYDVVSTTDGSDGESVLLHTTDVGAATTMYTKTINQCSVIAQSIDAWFTKNKPMIDKGLDRVIDRIVDNYGTGMED